MADAPLIVTPEVVANLHDLRDRAAKKPIEMQQVMQLLKTRRGARLHKDKMTAQTIRIPGAPWPFFVTFSIENGHPAGTCRHMSMSIMRDGRVPHPAGVWMVAEEMGFSGGLEACRVWIEDLSDGGKAINIVQPIRVLSEHHERKAGGGEQSEGEGDG